LSPRASARPRALALLLTAAGLAFGLSSTRLWSRPAAAPFVGLASAANAEATGDAKKAAGRGPGYVVMDLPAIRRALRGARGHALLVHFWASWCGPCLEELPVMERFAREMKPRGLEVLSLSLDDPERSGARVRDVLTQSAPGLTRAIARIDDTETFINDFDAQWEGSIPALFAYDRHGQLRGRVIGETTRRELEQLVKPLLKP
jgi:thiol-disulfide isomerase/thioredoxin